MAGLGLQGRLHRSGAAPVLARPGVVLPRPEKPAPEVVSSACARTPCPASEGSDGDRPRPCLDRSLASVTVVRAAPREPLAVLLEQLMEMPEEEPTKRRRTKTK